MRRKKIIILIAVILALPLTALTVMFAIFQCPPAVNAIAACLQPLTGISLHIDDISLNRYLGMNLSGLHIQQIKENGFDFFLENADVDAGVGKGLKIEVEKILLTGSKFTFSIKDEKSETDLFEVLRKLPPIQLLEVRNGHLELKTESAAYSVPGVNLTIRDFKPEGGGKLNGNSRFNIRYNGTSGQGRFEVDLDINRMSPRLFGSGSFRLFLVKGSSGSMMLDDLKLTTGLALNGNVFSLHSAKAEILSLSRRGGSGKIDMRNIKAQLNGSLDQKTSAFNITSFEGSASGIGMLKGRGAGTVKPLTWRASLRASSLDLAQVFGLVQPLLPEDYRKWTFKGKGGLEVESEGRRSDGAMVWKAAAIIDLSEGGFASADSSKAGERITGRIELKVGSPEKKRQGSFNITLEGSEGEFLWGQYYQDFKGEKVTVVSQGTFAQNPFSLASSGTFDLFQTGHYVFSVDISQNSSVFFLDAKGVSCRRLFGILMQNYMQQNYPNLQDMTLDGETDLKLTASISKQRKMIEGNLALRGGAVRSPSNQLLLTGLNISLPYDIVLAGTPSPGSVNEAGQGFLAFELLEKGTLRIDKLKTPVALYGNRFILPNPIDFSTLGGKVHMAGFRAENLLSPETRVQTGVTIQNLDLGQLIGSSVPFTLTGLINGDLSSIVFQDGKWNAYGELVIQIFGGRVTIGNIYAGRLFSLSRFFGADAEFDNIDLEAVTESIEVGRMTGLVKGYLKNFMMEYGQPVSFDLVITSDRSRKVPQRISVDAIKNISIIGTGSGAVSAVLSSGLNQFFKDYPYSEIGIRCTLADDIFSLRGLIYKGGNEYLVRRAWFRGIDVINQNPDNAISFKDMAERVGRIFQPREESRNMSSG